MAAPHPVGTWDSTWFVARLASTCGLYLTTQDVVQIPAISSAFQHAGKGLPMTGKATEKLDALLALTSHCLESVTKSHQAAWGGLDNAAFVPVAVSSNLRTGRAATGR